MNNEIVTLKFFKMKIPHISFFFRLRFLFFIAAFFLFSFSYSQQVPHYSNYLFNNYGSNPAFVSKSNCLEVKVGRRNQWIGFPNGPLTTFIGVNKVVGKKPFRNSWHGVGVYLEQDKQDFLKTDAIYPSYSYHMRMTGDYFASFGIFTGVKMFSMGSYFLDPDDPAFASSGSVIVVPDIAVGARFYSKSNFFDFSVRQTYKNKINLGAKRIGSPSKLVPHLNVIAGRRIESTAYYYSYLPSVNLKLAYLSQPTVDVSFMMFIKNKIGFGLSYRFNDALIGMVQYKYKNLLSFAFSYDYILSGMRVAAAHSREIMIGFTSCPPGADLSRSTGCPAYDH